MRILAFGYLIIQREKCVHLIGEFSSPPLAITLELYRLLTFIFVPFYACLSRFVLTVF